jgi:hypothetical protein
LWSNPTNSKGLSKSKFLFYIGSSINIQQRDKNHNIKKLLLNRKGDENLGHKLGLIYKTTDYLKKFKELYPSYTLSKGEWVFLSKLTDMHLKLLEQSLLTSFEPILNKTYKATPKYLGWKREWLEFYGQEKDYR